MGVDHMEIETIISFKNDKSSFVKTIYGSKK